MRYLQERPLTLLAFFWRKANTLSKGECSISNGILSTSFCSHGDAFPKMLGNAHCSYLFPKSGIDSGIMQSIV